MNKQQGLMGPKESQAEIDRRDRAALFDEVHMQWVECIEAQKRAESARITALAEKAVRGAPRVPRDTEPMHLIEAATLAVGGLALFALTAGAVGWTVGEVVEWVGDLWSVLTWR